MTLMELQQILGERIRTINDLAMGEEERKKEYEKTDITIRVAKQMINNADVVLRRDKALVEGKITADSEIAKW